MNHAPLSQQRRLEVGTVLRDRYEVQGVMGSGGFATVYEGFDRVIERPVAIKVMHLFGEGPDAEEDERGYELRLKRFEREARAAARISHPNVVNIFDLGRTARARPFIVMERLVGHNLDTEIAEHGAITSARALPLMCRVLEAVGVGHRLGIVHRDIKPANLFLTSPGLPDENLRVLDFGLAHLGFDRARLTQTHQAAGTMGYLAPEYIQERRISPAMDVYQLSLVLVEMLIGSPLIQATNPLAAIVAHTEAKYELPRWLRTGPLGALIVRGLDLDPGARYTDAHAMLADLAKVDPDDVQPTAKPSADEQPTAPRDRSTDLTTPRDVAPPPPPPVSRSHQPTHRVERPPLRRTRLPASPIVIGALGALLLMISFVGAVFILTNWLVEESAADRLTPQAAAAQTPAQVPAPADATPPTTPIAVAEAPAASSADAGQSAPAIVLVEVATTPPGATVREGSIEHGTTPMTLTLASAASKPIRLEIARDGYLPVIADVRPTDAPRIEFVLAPAQVPTPAAPAAEPKPAVISKPAPADRARAKKSAARKPAARAPEPKKEFVFGVGDVGPARMVSADDDKPARPTPRKSRGKLRMAE